MLIEPQKDFYYELALSRKDITKEKALFPPPPLPEEDPDEPFSMHFKLKKKFKSPRTFFKLDDDGHRKSFVF